MEKDATKKLEKKSQKKATKKEVKLMQKAINPKGSLRNHLLTQSSYLKSLLDPLNEVGARIPDEVTQPSLTAHCIQRLQVTTTANGHAGCSVICGSLNGTATATNICDIATSTTLATALQSLEKQQYAPSPAGERAKIPAISSLDLKRKPQPSTLVGPSGSKTGPPKLRDAKAPGAVGDFVWTAWDGDTGSKVYASGLRATASECRLVSGGLYGFYQGTPESMSGRVVTQAWSRVENQDGSVYQQPPTGVGDSTQPPLPSTGAMLNQRVCADRALVPAKGQGSIKYLPTDAGDRLYSNCNPLDGNYAAVSNGRLTVVFDGLPEGAVVEFWIVENYELLPLYNLIDLASPQPSESDPVDMALVSNVIAANPNLQVAPMRMTQGQITGKVDSLRNGPIVTNPQPSTEPGVMKSLFSFIEQAIPIGEKLLPLVGPLLALL